MICDLHIHTLAYHDSGHYESFVPGVGALCETDWKNLRAGIGIYRNSIKKTSVYSNLDYQPLHIGPVKLGPSLGIATGYAKYVVPMGGLAISYPVEKFENHLLIIPMVKNLTPLTIQYSFSIKFK